jgi:hypothetical protein
MVFTTYSQMQTLKGETTARRSFLSMMRCHKSTMIFDESHNARWPGERAQAARACRGTARVRPRSGEGQRRVLFVGDLRQAAGRDGPVCRDRHGDGGRQHRATWARRSRAAACRCSRRWPRCSRSPASISAASAPSTASTTTRPGCCDHDTYDQIAFAAAIQDFSNVKGAATGRTDQGGRASDGHDNATGDAGALDQLHLEVMHNIINQMLLAMKARRGREDRAIAAHQERRKAGADGRQHHGGLPQGLFRSDRHRPATR